MIAGDLPDIPEYMDVGSLKVHAPTAVVIVCGGHTSIELHTPVLSLRDALMRIAMRTKLSKFDIRRAEDVVRLPRIGYDDLLQLESDISQISELVMLFTESAGSLAELGIFVMDEEVAPKLLVIVDRFNYMQESFIRRGALDYLESTVGDQAVCVIDLIDHNVERIETVGNLNIDSFEDFISAKISDRLAIRQEPRTFIRSRSGHIIKLLTGLIQNYASLTYEEIDVLLYCIGISEPETKIKRLLGCAELFRWITIQKSGTRTFYSSTGGRIAVNFQLKDGAEKVNKRQWRADVREYWKSKDPDRFKCIAAAATQGVVI